jgi:hypothetical protein
LTTGTVLVSGRLICERRIWSWRSGSKPGICLRAASRGSSALTVEPRSLRFAFTKRAYSVPVATISELAIVLPGSQTSATANAVESGWVEAWTLMRSEPPSSSAASTAGSAPTVSTSTSRSVTFVVPHDPSCAAIKVPPTPMPSPRSVVCLVAPRSSPRIVRPSSAGSSASTLPTKVPGPMSITSVGLGEIRCWSIAYWTVSHGSTVQSPTSEPSSVTK